MRKSKETILKVCLNEYQMMICNATPDDLVSELERKGYEVSIKKKKK